MIAFLGTGEIVVILVVALLIFGPQKLPEIGKQIGSAVRELNRVRNDFTRALDLDEYGHSRYDNYNYNNQNQAYPPHSESGYNDYHHDTEDTGENALPAYQPPHGATATFGADDHTEYGARVYHHATEGTPLTIPPGPRVNGNEANGASHDALNGASGGLVEMSRYNEHKPEMVQTTTGQ
jgi:TatA/E family protein of Tat protein translocase